MSRTVLFDYPAATVIFTTISGGREVVTTIYKADGSSCTVGLDQFVKVLGENKPVRSVKL